MSILDIMYEGGFMRSFSATDAKQHLAAVLDAAQRGPVVIRRQNRDIAVLLSPEEYDRLRNVNAAEFQRFCDRVAIQAAGQGMNKTVLTELLSDEG
ncbi:MAG: type II toxin-antitoxin system Phd/YefM family antitoxin [Acidobacteriaceae bacterium]